ncbi:MAG: helix-turn-helix domain-containing protein [Oscillospiraceae bacterium]|nr:helix-turn-helix domain-containing protein [Oscillospiraceae bacterium]
MEQIYFGERIAAYRKEQGLTQEGLAQQLGVTNQAVSKWESDQCCPDIMLLPALADVFGVSIDALFGREAGAQRAETEQEAQAVIDELPWPDDDDLRAVCYVGHRLMDYADVQEKKFSLGGLLNMHVGAGKPAELHFSGSVRDIHSAFGVVVENGTVTGSVYAEDGVECGDVGGDVKAGDGVSCGNVGGGVQAGDGVSCGDVGGDVRAGEGVNCGNVGGSVSAGESIRCGNIEGDARAGDNIDCGSIGGNATADRIIPGDIGKW